jgi:uncharacterized protein YecE (DUF72 family)
MAVWIGTSGYNYPEWKGTFYPEKLPAEKMLPYYAERFSSVEIDNTFYRMPNEARVSAWSQATPDKFKLTLKAPRRITHQARLQNCAEPLNYFLKTAATLGPKLGALLFQLSPYLPKDIALLESFLALLPAGVCASFEFRHASWLDDAVYERLKAKNLALCVSDSEKRSAPVEITADYAYFRLRDEGYDSDDIAQWAQVIRDKTSACKDVFVYFKHEEAGKGPELASLLMQQLGVA